MLRILCVPAYTRRMQTHLTIQEMLRDLLTLGLTQKKIAEATGLAQYQISKWTKHKVPPSAEHAGSIARLHAEVAAKAKRRAARAARLPRSV